MDQLNPEEIVIPTVIIIILTLLLWIFLSFLFKNNRKAGIIVSLGLVLFFSYGHFANLLLGVTLMGFQIGRHEYLFVPFLVSLVVGIYIVTKTKNNLTEATTIANVIAISLIVISLVNIGTYALKTQNSLIFHDVEDNEIIPLINEENPPNIYYIIFDEYTSSEILRDVYNYDNQDFLSSLNERGFYVASNSHSNYAATFLSVTSSLNMEYLNYFSDEIGIDSKDRKLPSRIFDNNKVMRILKLNNYTIVNLGLTPGNPSIADYDLCTGQIFTNELQIILWQSTVVGPFLVTILDGGQPQRDLILCKFSELSNLHLTTTKPFFVYAHFVLPHPPYFFGADGESISPISLHMGASVWKNKPGYVNQVKFTNKKALETIDKILTQSDRPPIMIIQGDHGTPTLLGGGGLYWNNRTDEAIRERMSILNAYYLPEEGRDLLYETITPVNSFRLIFNNYFNATYNLLEDKMYFSDYNNPYNFTDVTNSLMIN